ncbi:MAG: hypothetical protein Q8N23_05130 [Archangium sp.]|nr:hypothetical protein [Archangium sp.]MDP3152029.1 hypothetical protein [Archangium sp.]MDP3575485.1 hypothetical protein [Archangium sp.]
MHGLLVLLLATNDCVNTVTLDGKPLIGGPTEFCIREVVRVRLDDEPFIALRVEAPHRFDQRIRSRVFIYRLIDGRLVPRFLGSGFTSREITRLFVLDGAVGLDTVSASGVTQTLRCVFDGFPLACTELN